MSADADDRSLRGLLGDWVRRKLQPGEPETWIEGGGSRDDPLDRRGHERDREELDEYERAYVSGGPVAQLVDTRSQMTFGTGSEFVTRDEDVTVTGPEGEPETAAEWLERELPNRDNLFVGMGRDNYVYGDAFAEVVETRGGGFSHVVLVNPKTIRPEYDVNGEVRRWIQEIDDERAAGVTKRTQAFDPEDIGHVALHRLGRHPMGVSLVGRNWDEIQRFAQNQHYIAKTVERHGMRKWDIQAGNEDGPAVGDRELRRVRQRFKSVKQNDAIVHGADVSIEPMDEGPSVGDGIATVAENDLTMLAAGFGVPEEMAGLGRGSTEATAKVRLQAFERTARAEQRALADQFVEQVVRPILREYSPFPEDVHVDLRFDDIVSDQAATAEWLRNFKGIYSPDEMREKLGDGPVPEDVDEEDLGVPGDEGETADPPDGGGGFFSARGLAQSVPDNAVSIDSPAEAPEDASVIRGPKGGLYYVPGGADGDAPANAGERVTAEDVGPGDEVIVDATIEVEQDGEFVEVDISEDEVEILDIRDGALQIRHPEHGDQILFEDDFDAVYEAEGGAPNPSEVVDNLGVDFADTQDGNLTDEQVTTLRDGLAEAYGEGTVDSAFETLDAWKRDSTGEAGAELEANLAEALDLEGEQYRRENADRDVQVTDRERSVFQALHEASQSVFREEFGDSAEVHRGINEAAVPDVLAEAMEADGDVEFDMSAVSATSTDPEVAELFAVGRRSATVSWDVSAEDTALAIDAVTGGEADQSEILAAGAGVEVAPEDITLYPDDGEGGYEEVTVAEWLENPDDYPRLTEQVDV